MNHLNTFPPQQNPFNQKSGFTFKDFLKWFFGIVFLMMALMLLITDQAVFSFICWTLGAVVLIPPLLKALEKRFKHQAPRPLKYIMVIGLYILGIIGAVDSKGFDLKPSDNSGVVKKVATPVINSSSDNATIDSVSPTAKANGDVNSSEKDEERQKKIEKQFSPWDGSHMKLVFYVKDNMNDPDSFEHVSTSYWDKGSYLVVLMKYRGKNAFGGRVINYIKAKIDLDGNVLGVLDNQ